MTILQAVRKALQSEEIVVLQDKTKVSDVDYDGCDNPEWNGPQFAEIEIIIAPKLAVYQLDDRSIDYLKTFQERHFSTICASTIEKKITSENYKRLIKGKPLKITNFIGKREAREDYRWRSPPSFRTGYFCAEEPIGTIQYGHDSAYIIDSEISAEFEIAIHRGESRNTHTAIMTRRLEIKILPSADYYHEVTDLREKQEIAKDKEWSNLRIKHEACGYNMGWHDISISLYNEHYKEKALEDQFSVPMW